MVPKTETPNPDVDRALKVLENERKTWPTYKRPSSLGSYLILILVLAVAGVIVYSILNHKGQISRLWDRATHRDSVPAEVHPDQ